MLVGLDAAAAAGGLAPGMALADARAILPSLATAPADPPAEARALERLAGWCTRYCPWTAVEAPPDEDDGSGAVWLDVSGTAHLFGGEAALLADLTARLAQAGHDGRAGLADTPGAAWAAARFLAGGKEGAPAAILPAGGTREALAPLPVAALRLAPETVAGLESLGLRTVGALATLPRAALAARFGAGPAARLDAALGAVAEPISPVPLPEPHFVRLAFAEPIGRAEDLAAALDRLADALCAGLARRGRGARRLVLALYEPDGAFRRFAAGTSRASRDTAHLARLFAEPLDGIEAAFGIEAMTLAAPETEPLGAAQADLAARQPDGSDAAALVDRLAGRLGPARVVRFAARESHLPERAVEGLPALDAPEPGRAPAAAWPDRPRPLRLFARPEPIEATAPIPDDPPVMFRWRRVLHRVARAEGPERIAPEWWRTPDSAGAGGPALRDYYRVEVADGRRLWLYREGLYRGGTAPAWFVHGIFG